MAKSIFAIPGATTRGGESGVSPPRGGLWSIGPNWSSASTDALLEKLKAPEDWTRQRAKQVLKERGAAEVVPRLAAWVGRLDPKQPEYEHHRLEALWTYQTVDTVEPALLRALLHSRDSRVRAAATRIVPLWKSRLSDPGALLATQVSDPDPRVCLEAVRGLVQVPSTKAAASALEAVDRPLDTFLEYALWLTARQLAPYWLPESEAGRFDVGGHPERLIFALRAVDSPAVIKPLLELIKRGRVPKDQDESVQTLIARLGGPDDLALVLDVAVANRGIPAPGGPPF